MSHRITLEGGDGFEVSAGEDSLLRGALRAGVGFPYDCSVGGCGTCRFDLVSGEMESLWDGAPGLSERDRRRGKRLACQSRPRSDCTIKVRIGEECRPPVAPRRRKALLAERRAVTASMAEFVLRTEEPAHFIAGQYAVFHPPGAEGARAYSMSNLPNEEGEWRFVIRRVPGGRGSNAMFDAVAIGDTLELDGPYGHAHFRAEVPRDVVCIAGGSGIGPVVSVARAAVEAMPGRRLLVFEGARTREDLCFPALMGAAQGGVAAYTPVLSAEADDSGWDGVRGFVHEEVERAVGHRAAECEFYFAGPPPMTEALQRLLIVNWSVPLARIHFDRFF